MTQAKRKNVRSGWFAAAAVAISVVLPAAARADVRDGAHIFSGQAVSAADAAMQQMQDKYHKQFVVETFPAIPDDLKGAFQSKGKEAFFKEWMANRAHAIGVDGVYTLVCMEPGHVQVGVGKETAEHHIVTPQDRDAIERDFQTAFQAKNYDQGLSTAVAAVERNYGANIPYEPPQAGRTVNQNQRPAPSSPAYPNKTPAAPPASHGFFGKTMIGGLICLGLGLLIVFALVKSVFGSRGGNAGGGMFGGGANRGGNYPTGGPTYGPGGGGVMGGGPVVGGGGYGVPTQGGGGGFGRGLLGGLLGGAVGGYAADKFEHRNDPATSAGTASSGGDFGGGGGGGSSSGGFDSGPSDAGQGFGDNSSGGDFGGGASSADTGSSGGDFGGGGGDSGGGGGGDSGGSGGDF